MVGTAEAINGGRALMAQDDILALALRAKSDAAAIDELAVALATTSEAARKGGRRIESLERQIAALEHRLSVLLRRTFGRSTEKIDPDQLRLFLGEAAPPEAAPTTAPEDAVTATAAARPKGHGRQTFPPHVPRDEIKLDPSTDECLCPACKSPLARIREEVTERGHFVPGYWKVKRYLRGVWACTKGCGEVLMAPLPPTVIDKSRFEPSVAIHTAIAKYGDHLPLHRQEEIHARLGVPVPASTLGDGVANLGTIHEPTVEQMRREMVAESVVHADDTPVIALVDTDGEPAPDGRKKKRKERIETRIWVYLAMSGKVFFDFTKTRSHEGPLQALKGFGGRLVTDGYAGFNEVIRRFGLLRCGCWAHVRRKFRDAIDSDRTRASRAILLINRLFRIEAAAKIRMERGPPFGMDDLLGLRRRRSTTQLEKIRRYLTAIHASVLPKSPIGDATSYALNQWAALTAFVEHPDVAIHNNAAERALRAIAVGRKNYLFMGSLAGGKTAVVFYTLIGSCKALGLDPYAYLRDTTEALLASPATPREQLTPWAWAKSRGQRLLHDADSEPVRR